jgi:hypothetical protein
LAVVRELRELRAPATAEELAAFAACADAGMVREWLGSHAGFAGVENDGRTVP